MNKKKNSIAIIGAGYVGLDLAVAFSKKCSLLCYDVDKKRIQKLNKSIDLNKQHDGKKILNKNLTFSFDKEKLKDLDFYIVTVPTPIKRLNIPDLQMLKNASKVIGRSIKKNSTIIFESTTFPGCTEEVCIPIIEKSSNLKYLKDFNIAYSPERVNPGDKINTLNTITKIVGANDQATLLKVKKLYRKICKKIYTVSSIKVAESAKAIENIQRDVNIALVNELGVLFNKLKIPTNEVLKAASTKWNFHYYKPGLVGGHCISVDPYYLAFLAKKKNYYPKLILSGRKLNESMGGYIGKQTLKLVTEENLKFRNIRIALLGFAFKDNIPDIRNTKIIQIINYFKKLKINVDIFDPIVVKSEVRKLYKINIKDFNKIETNKYDVIVLAVSHDVFLKKINYYSKFYKDKNKKIFIDVKNNYSSTKLKKENFNFFQM